jgi:bifunctional DNA-binding transcriptional regulator/antitoxin component of YhaV-PrlF toxin-antitoxin module
MIDKRDLKYTLPIDPRLVRLAMPDGLPDTVRRLVNIKPGQQVVYYRGDFDADVAVPRISPIYRSLIERIRETALSLQKSGNVTLLEREISRRSHSSTEHVAIGRLA